MIKKQLKKRFKSEALYGLFKLLCYEHHSASWAIARMHDWLYEIVD